MSATALCLVAGLITARLPVPSFTLAWTHSIEKIPWEEDWRLDADRLLLDVARIRGTGAGMEPPAGATLKAGVWYYAPTIAPIATLRLTHSPHAAAYELCAAEDCRPLPEWLPGLPADAVIELSACPTGVD